MIYKRKPDVLSNILTKTLEMKRIKDDFSSKKYCRYCHYCFKILKFCSISHLQTIQPSMSGLGNRCSLA